MATFPKISDNEMNYFQFKARQMLLLKKENREWTNLCKKTAPECPACSAEKVQTDSNSLRNIGIQVSPKKTFKAVEKPPLHPKYRKDLVPETLEDIKSKLENIDLALTKLHETSTTKETVLKHESISLPYSAMKIQDMKLKSLEDKRKLLIQKSLKDSLQRIEHIHKISEKADKPVIPIRKKNCGYFLPHDLQQKRVAARNAYLASLKNKPKVELSSSLQDKKKNISNTLNKNISSKSIPKFRKKTIPKVNKTESTQTNIPTMLESSEVNETKDENIEQTVDGILEDLLGEAAADLNRIKIDKSRTSFQVNQNKGEKDSSKTTVESSQVNTVPKELITEKEKLKLFWNLPDSLSDEQKDGKQVFEEIAKTTFPNKVLKNVLNEPNCEMKQSSSNISQAKKFYEIGNPPKFVCAVSHLISIDPDKAKQISTSRKRFWDYLKSVSRTENGDFNPWIVGNMVAEAILDDCIQDISEELCDLPSTLIKDLYNQEFMQQVDF